MLEEIKEAITEHWGERCTDYDPQCSTCKVWKQFDEIAEAVKAECEEIAKLIEWPNPRYGILVDKNALAAKVRARNSTR